MCYQQHDKTLTPGDPCDEMKTRAFALKYDFEHLYDGSQEIAKPFDATNTPHLFVHSRQDGKLLVD